MGDLHRLGIRRFQSNEKVDMAVREWLPMQKKSPVSTATYFLNSCRRSERFTVLWDYAAE